MFDRTTVQSEVDYRRERLSRTKPVRRRRTVNRSRFPFIGRAR
jgi:hypothetical protein